MTRTPQWKAARAVRRERERLVLAERRRIIEESRKADELRLAFDEMHNKMRVNINLGETKPLMEVWAKAVELAGEKP